jgi:hypothetical protein
MEYKYTASLQRTNGTWSDYAQFAWHSDAVIYAEMLTRNWRDVVLRVTGGLDYVDLYYTNGAETSDVEMAA